MNLPSDESPRNRPRDIIDFVEKSAAEVGNFHAIDDQHYKGFLNLSPSEVRRLVVIMMLSQEAEVCRLASTSDKTTPGKRVSEMICNGLHVLSIGLMAVDAFGRLQMFARVGPEPDQRMHEALEKRLAQMESVVADEVGRTLPWLLSRRGSQGQLPL